MIEADLLNYVDHKAADEFENFTPVCTHSFIMYMYIVHIYGSFETFSFLNSFSGWSSEAAT